MKAYSQIAYKKYIRCARQDYKKVISGFCGRKMGRRGELFFFEVALVAFYMAGGLFLLFGLGIFLGLGATELAAILFRALFLIGLCNLLPRFVEIYYFGHKW